jgi:ADP-heptose:LPS heptosyltransferase
MKAIIIKKDLKFRKLKMKAGALYVFNEMQTAVFNKALKSNNLLNHVDIKPIDAVLREFPCTNINRIYIIRAGGIGDLIALSSLCTYIELELNIKVTIITQSKYAALFAWFTHPITYKYWLEPLAIYNMLFRLKNKVAYLNFEGKIESTNENWYHLFFEKFRVDFNQWGRPILSLPGKANTRIVKKNNILLTLKATANIRTINFKPVYEALCAAGINKYIYVHADNLSQLDSDFIKEINDKRIKVIRASSLAEFLIDGYSAAWVISTDTGALHFREGLSLPAIGLYNSFSAECRTKYYKYTKSFNIQSNCPYQPCFKHANKSDDICKNFQGNRNVAPCVDPDINTGLVAQLTNIFANNL